MSYTAQTAKAVGDPITYIDWNVNISNAADHELRIGALELVSANIQVMNGAIHNASSFTTLTGFKFWQAPFAFTLTSAVVGIWEKGALTGTLEVDVKRNTSRNPAGFSTVFTTKPSILYSGAVDYQDSTNGVFDIVQKNLIAGTWLRFDLTQVPTSGTISKLSFVLFGEL